MLTELGVRNGASPWPICTDASASPNGAVCLDRPAMTPCRMGLPRPMLTRAADGRMQAEPHLCIDAAVGGRAYKELRVDGGAVAQLFLCPPSIIVGRAISNMIYYSGSKDIL